MSHQTVIVLDFGGQYNQLIARRVRECGVYCEVKPYTTPLADIRAMNPIGIIFTGGPNSVYDPKSPQVDPAIFTWGVPILGICYGCQLMAHNLGGRVTEAQDDSAREYGKTETYFDSACKLFKGLPAQGITWMSHGDYMEKVPEGFALVAHSDACPNVAICDESRGFYGVQYHPEVNHTEHGTDMIRNFLYEVCGAAGDWTMGDYKETAIRQIREKVGDGKVLLALSGGVDSSVAAALVAEAVGSQLTCVFVDHGLMRLNEGDEVEEAFKKWDINFVRANAEELFLSKLSGVSEPERKRKIIGEEFIRVFEAEAKKIGQVDYLVQGTIYPDVIESGTGDAAVIKSHHNVGGLPDYVDFKEIIEPLRMLFKDEVRQLGRELGLPEYLVMRQPFPGPGLAIRVIGEEFIRVFEAEAKKIGQVDYLAQGTIYPDVIESGAGDAAVIKSHHNVGGLPDYVDFKEIIEPLRMLFKDEVRQLGRELGLPEYLVMRQPFPGPGLAIRCLGDVTKEKLDILRLADFIFRDEVAKAHLESAMSQYFAVLTNMRSVGVQGDGRTYDYTLALRSVTTTDFMTADWTRIPYDVLDRVSVRIVNEVPHINRIVYDITSKPPATIEWE
ncbi:glutamine-hydrolyzing GMP synthase [Dysosmobacter welbionis]|uniref:glutamine-hydrolyzing GMP synthase n=1 Tax=Dysosmobacter welbionis TaxID=2093857 RepID=UPI002353058E|nr:glutamine-hydrolyzing GMP synthase [Dysosmobacter welbionis]